MPTNCRPFNICERNKMIISFLLLLSIREFSNIYCHEQKNGLLQARDIHCPHDKSTIEANLKNDTTEGGILAEFALAPTNCRQDMYAIALVQGTSKLKEQECENKTENEQPHSLKSFIINDCPNGSCHNICGQHGTVSFSDVISGCYRLRLQLQFLDQSYVTYFSPWIYIKTNFDKNWKQEVTLNKHFDSKNNVKQLNFTFSKATSSVRIEYDDSKGNHINHQLIETSSFKSTPCQPYQEGAYTGGLKRFKKIICKFDSAIQEMYHFKVTLFNDDHCDSNIKDSQHQFKNTICYRTIRKEIDFKDTESDHEFTAIIVIVTCFVIILPVFGMIIWKLKKYMNRTDRAAQSSFIPLQQVSTMNCNTEVLLLYSRDCEHFMKTMKSFKEMLEEICHITVYDCFDDLNWENEVTYPQQWIDNLLLNRSNLRTIIVTSVCAVLQQRAHQSGIWDFNNSLFKEPTYLDNLFIYSLKYFILDQSNVVHQRIFIIRLKDFSDGIDLLGVPTASRVYKIPLHLAKLFRDMAITDYRDDPEQENDFGSYSTYNTFVCHLRNLEAFARSNKNYLEELLITSVNV